jgi:citrate lyase subunit beta/citryl-CoA lyase/(S)-citramalyl-CoA lyase
LAVGKLADFVMIPKAVSAGQMRRVAALAPNRALWPLIETARGLKESWVIASAPAVEGVLFGGFDYAADIGCAMDWEPLLFARSQIVAACSAACRQALDSPSGDINDSSGLAESTRRAKALGFSGRACIHPNQIGPVNAVFTPSEADVTRAQRIVDAFDVAAGGAAQLDGRLIELPVALAARRTLGLRRY